MEQGLTAVWKAVSRASKKSSKNCLTDENRKAYKELSCDWEGTKFFREKKSRNEKKFLTVDEEKGIKPDAA